VYSFWLGKLHQRQAELRLTPPALETLAIVAYRQPITRADIEKVRRVNCTDMLKHLMDRSLVRIGGEDDSLGRPFLYETTRQFLELFGLRSLDALPMAESLRKPRAVPMLSTESDGSDSDASDSAA
jgi:segregation and condensation protein B